MGVLLVIRDFDEGGRIGRICINVGMGALGIEGWFAGDALNAEGGECDAEIPLHSFCHGFIPEPFLLLFSLFRGRFQNQGFGAKPVLS